MASTESSDFPFADNPAIVAVTAENAAILISGAPPAPLLRDDAGVGLANLSATCYLNALLQCLFATTPLRHAIFRWTPPTEAPQPALPAALQGLFARLAAGATSVQGTESVTAAFGWGAADVDATAQQDAAELASLLLDELERAGRESSGDSSYDEAAVEGAGAIANRSKTHGSSGALAQAVRKIFRGIIADELTCSVCLFKRRRLDAFMGLELPMLRSACQEAPLSPPDLRELFAAYLAPETLAGADAVLCSACNTRSPARKSLHLLPAALPDCLFLHLKRFAWDPSTSLYVKITDGVRIPLTLDMSAVASGNSAGCDAPRFYDLYGLLLHAGSASSGHYIALTRLPNRGACGGRRWLCFNDAHVSAVSDEELSKLLAGGGCSPQTYKAGVSANDHQTRGGSSVPGRSASVPSNCTPYVLCYEARDAATAAEQEVSGAGESGACGLGSSLLPLALRRAVSDENTALARAHLAHAARRSLVTVTVHALAAVDVCDGSSGSCAALPAATFVAPLSASVRCLTEAALAHWAEKRRGNCGVANSAPALVPHARDVRLRRYEPAARLRLNTLPGAREPAAFAMSLAAAGLPSGGTVHLLLEARPSSGDQLLGDDNEDEAAEADYEAGHAWPWAAHNFDSGAMALRLVQWSPSLAAAVSAAAVARAAVVAAAPKPLPIAASFGDAEDDADLRAALAASLADKSAPDANDISPIHIVAVDTFDDDVEAAAAASEDVLYLSGADVSMLDASGLAAAAGRRLRATAGTRLVVSIVRQGFRALLADGADVSLLSSLYDAGVDCGAASVREIGLASGDALIVEEVSTGSDSQPAALSSLRALCAADTFRVSAELATEAAFGALALPSNVCVLARRSDTLGAVKTRLVDAANAAAVAAAVSLMADAIGGVRSTLPVLLVSNEMHLRRAARAPMYRREAEAERLSDLGIGEGARLWLARGAPLSGDELVLTPVLALATAPVFPSTSRAPAVIYHARKCLPCMTVRASSSAGYIARLLLGRVRSFVCETLAHALASTLAPDGRTILCPQAGSWSPACLRLRLRSCAVPTQCVSDTAAAQQPQLQVQAAAPVGATSEDTWPFPLPTGYGPRLRHDAALRTALGPLAKAAAAASAVCGFRTVAATAATIDAAEVLIEVLASPDVGANATSAVAAIFSASSSSIGMTRGCRRPILIARELIAGLWPSTSPSPHAASAPANAPDRAARTRAYGRYAGAARRGSQLGVAASKLGPAAEIVLSASDDEAARALCESISSLAALGSASQTSLFIAKAPTSTTLTIADALRLNWMPLLAPSAAVASSGTAAANSLIAFTGSLRDGTCIVWRRGPHFVALPPLGFAVEPPALLPVSHEVGSNRRPAFDSSPSGGIKESHLSPGFHRESASVSTVAPASVPRLYIRKALHSSSPT